MTIKNLDKKIRAYALKNALSHGGKASAGSVVAALFVEGLKKENVKDVMPKIEQEIKKIGQLSLKDQEKEFNELRELVSEREIREGLPELPNVSKKGVVMRIAPSPSGPLHVGHAIVAGLCVSYVKRYGGTFYVRIEDTNPENIDPKAYDLITKDATWLYPPSKIIIQSDRMEIYYSYVEKLIKKNAVYVCTCSGDAFREFSKEKENCPCRNASASETKKRWKQMFEAFRPGEAVLRFKSSMSHPNPAMRDFPLARINETPHPLAKKKYRVWPLMNLAVSVDDIELGMTHIIRGKDHRDNAERQKMLFEVLDKKYPWAKFIGRVHFKDFVLSTTDMRKGISEKKYSGWDDSKLPTLLSFKKQGYRPEAFLKFAESVSTGENDKIMEKKEFLTMLKGFNKKS